MLKDTLQEMVKTIPAKSLSQTIKGQKDIYNELQEYYGDTLAEKINTCINGDTHICKYGNLRQFTSIPKGYRNCGTSSTCQCSKEQVSKTVSKQKRSYTPELNAEINEKRHNTNIDRYGLKNAGQTKKALENHKLFYSDPTNVQKVVLQVSNTKFERYGNKNYNNINQIKKTYKEKHNAKYWAMRFNNEYYHVLNDKLLLEEYSKTYTMTEMSELFNVHVQTIYRHMNFHNLRTKFVSSEELELRRFIDSLGINNVIYNTRKLLPSGKEIDIYLPDYELAIEYNGVYWHHEDVDHITKTYHKDKFEQCQKLGIQLITVFSNFWHCKKDIVKQTIINKLGLSTESVFARKCIIKEVTSIECREFLNKYHIQGYTPASIKLGLYYQNILVCLMTFSKPRIGIGTSYNGYELVRYVSSSRVIGGASKLLNHFIKLYNPDTIVSYSDNEWSTGNMYSKLNFTLETELPVSYWYLHPKEEKLSHRYNFAKHKLLQKGYDKSLTELEITKKMGLLRLWDCGKRKWVLKLT
jgi:G:T-mismatch repair DNA endonuclease (very short patch repair protein)